MRPALLPKSRTLKADLVLNPLQFPTNVSGVFLLGEPKPKGRIGAVNLLVKDDCVFFSFVPYHHHSFDATNCGIIVAFRATCTLMLPGGLVVYTVLAGVDAVTWETQSFY